MALAFPAGPTGGQQYTGPNGIVYQWDAGVGVWIKVNSVQTVTSGATAGTGAARIPTGNTAARPAATLAAGQFRYNSQLLQLEYSDGTSWLAAGGLSAANLAQAQAGNLATVAATPETAVPKNAAGMTGSAFIPAGDTSQRPAAATYTGQFRYNTQIPQLEYSNGTSWLAVGGGTAATLLEAQAGTLNTVFSSPQTAVPKDASGMAGSAFMPAGNTAARPAFGTYTGQLRYNTQIPQWEYSDGAAWIQLVPSGTLTAASLAEAATGTINTKYSSPETAVPKNASGMTGSAFMPAGNTAAQPAAATYTGQLRYNTQVPQWEYSDGASWLPLVSSSSLSAASLAEAAAGTVNTKYSSPQTAVPKDASGMTGAALIPGGNDAARPATPVTGMVRYNNQGGTPATTVMEYWNGSAWTQTWGSGAVTPPAVGSVYTAFLLPAGPSYAGSQVYPASVSGRTTYSAQGGAYTGMAFAGVSNVVGPVPSPGTPINVGTWVSTGAGNVSTTQGSQGGAFYPLGAVTRIA